MEVAENTSMNDSELHPSLLQLTDDVLEEHKTEIDILQSIFPDHFMLENTGCVKKCIYSFKIAVEVFLPSDQDSILLEVLSSEDTDISTVRNTVCRLDKKHKPDFQRTKSGKRWYSEITVKHLPPLILHISLPSGYPAEDSPFYTISCGWLGAKDLTRLCKELDSLWMENKGQPIIYTWIDWLQNNTLSCLKIEDQIVIVSCNVEDVLSCGCDARALPTCVNVGTELGRLLCYDYENEYKRFCIEYQTCSVCFLEKLGAEFFRLPNCGHHFCRDCVSSFCEMHVKEGSVLRMNCPAPDCDYELPVEIIQQALEPDAIERWERILLQRALDLMGDIVWCPRCQQATIREPEEELNLAYCLPCHFAFCIECKNAWHQGRTCEEVEDEQMEDEEEEEEEAEEEEEEVEQDEENMNQNQEDNTENQNSEQDSTQDQPQEIVQNVNNEPKRRDVIKKDRMSRALIKTKTKKCPVCKVPIEKSEGCNKVTCSLCWSYFCWICGKEIKGYEHFSTGCNLFSYNFDDEMVEREPRPDPRPVELVEFLEQNEDITERIMNCPRCHQRNLKNNNNNHIKCWACKTNLCFYCKKIIDGIVSKHFLNKPCKQHS